MLEQNKLKQIIEIGKSYRYNELCELINEQCTKAQNKKKEQLDDWSRFFDYEIISKYEYVVHKVYDTPLPGLDNGYFYKTIRIPVKCSAKDYEYLKKCTEWSAQCWNDLVKADSEYYINNGIHMNRAELQNFVKNRTPLHAAGNQHVCKKYFDSREAMFKSIQAGHKNSYKVELPHKEKTNFVVAWNAFNFTIDYTNKKMYLARKQISNGLYQSPVCCTFKSIPRYIVEIELISKDRLYLAIKYKEPKINFDIQGDNVAAIDLGEIHSISSIDNNGNAIIITGRKLRDITRFRNKEQAKIKSKQTRTTKGSRKYKKYSNALLNLSVKTNNQIFDSIHKISKLYLDYCIRNNITKVYYGDLDSCTRNTRGRVNKIVGQKLNNWSHGLLTLQLQNKLSRYGVEMIKVSEAYSSQTCPHCGNKNKPSGRNYECQCGYKQHRDLVGAMNILNFNEKDVHIERYNNLKYLRID